MVVPTLLMGHFILFIAIIVRNYTSSAGLMPCLRFHGDFMTPGVAVLVVVLLFDQGQVKVECRTFVNVAVHADFSSMVICKDSGVVKAEP